MVATHNGDIELNNILVATNEEPCKKVDARIRQKYVQFSFTLATAVWVIFKSHLIKL